MTIKYVVVPGPIVSKSDGEVHYINASKLMGLYKVSPRECVVRYYDHRDLGKNFDGLIQLHPRADGNYELPE